MDSRLTERIERIRHDSAHGASWLAKEAVETIVEASRLGHDPLGIARELVAARPAIGSIAGALGRVLASARNTEQLVEEAQAVLAARERASSAIAVLLKPGLEGVVMTHSASATAREALIHARPTRVVCTVSEPIGEGRRFSEELREEGLTVDLVADEDAARAVETASILLLGADTVFRDGTLLNKVGTAPLAAAAWSAGIPVLVACEVIKLAPADAHQPDEDRIDLTPAEHIDRYVTEEGEFAPEDIASLVDRTPFLVDGYALLRGIAH